MKALITSIEFDQEVATKFGQAFRHTAYYNDKKATFLTKYKDQKTFISGVENEFIEESRDHNGTIYFNIKSIKKQTDSNYGRALKREQARYAGFAMSYAKDLVVADKIKLDSMTDYTEKMFNLMVKLDKTLQS